jgi:ketosteroid isomerase-like protein
VDAAAQEPTIRRVYEAYNRRDLDAVVEILGPEFELQRVFAAPGRPAVISGGEELREWMKPDAFEEDRVEPLRFVVGSETVVVEVRDFGRAANSGVEIEQTGYHVWRVRDERLVRVELYYDREGAYAAAGLPAER